MKKILMLSTGLDNMGGIASVVTVYRDAGLFQRYPIEHVATHCDGTLAAKLGLMLRAYWRVLWQMLTGQVGLIHVHVASRVSFWRKSGLFLLAFLFRVPSILHLHGAEFAEFFEQECGPVRRALVRFIFNRCTRVVVLSEAWKNWVAGISDNPQIVAIYNPVLLPPPPAPWRTRTGGAILFLGRLGQRKGIYDLLDAAARTVAARPQLHLMLGGDGELAATTERAGQLGIAAYVDLLGWVKADEKERQLARSSLFVLPSYNEGLPMSVLEAMAAGLPILSTPIGGLPEAISDGVEGFLVEPGDVAALAQRLEQLLGDDALAERMGAAARRKVESTFCANVVLPRVERLYRDLGMGPR